MYGKLFSSMYEGTLYGQWQAIVTLQQLVILADQEGVVDMTPPAIAARTSIPLDIIQAGIEQLAKADQYSRSEAEGGRRIVLLDESRPWGWRIVNYRYYRDLASREEKKQKDRARIAEKRSKNNNVAGSRDLSLDVADGRVQSHEVADVAHTDTDTDTEEEQIGASPPGDAPTTSVPFKAIVDLYNRTMEKLPKVREITTNRRTLMRSAWKASKPRQSLEFWTGYFEECADDPFLNGTGPYRNGHENWLPSFDYLLRADVVTKVFERAMHRIEQGRRQ